MPAQPDLRNVATPLSATSLGDSVASRRSPVHIFGKTIKSAVKHGLPFFTEKSGIERLLWHAALRDRLLVLCYHSVIPDELAAETPLDDTVVSMSEFRRHLQILIERYQPCSLDGLLNRIKSGLPPSRPQVLITFDDGYRNNYVYAVPLLRTFGVPAVFAVTTSYIGGSTILWPNEVYLRIIHWPNLEVALPGGGMMSLPPDRTARRPIAEQIRDACKWIPGHAAREY